MGRFDGKVAIITGASSGIGQATALAFAKEGANVTITGRNAKRLAEAAKECSDSGAKVLDVVCEVGNLKELKPVIDKTVEAFGRIDILVNNAGTLLAGPIEHIKTEDYDRIINVNIRAPIFLCKYALPHLRKTKGSIINVSSSMSFTATPEMVMYCMTKAALDNFSKGFASECAADGIRVNCVNPGMVKTRILNEIMSEELVEKTRAQSVDAKQPLGLLKAEEIAGSILYLSESTGITGTTLVIDGGYLLL